MTIRQTIDGKVQRYVLSLLRRSQLAALKDLEFERQRAAVASTVAFADAELAEARAFPRAKAVLDYCLGLAPTTGLLAEFGVATGTSLRRIAQHRWPVHGFDSFEGLPEDWRPGYPAGTFAMEPPQIPGAELHIGWFDDTLPKFLAEHTEPFAFIHVDCDLYSSTKTILELCASQIVPGTVLLFDEYFNHHRWEQGEHLALTEFVAKGRRVRYVAYCDRGEQVAVVVEN